MTVELLEGERLDDLQNGYRLIQDPKDFCYGIDAVLLAWFARVKPGENVLDLGTGSGVVPLLMKARTEGKHFTGLEIQEKSAAMARRSVAWNHLEQDVSIVTGDIKEAAGLFGAASFDVVTSNGRFYMVHRPFRLAEIMGTMMKYHLEPKRMQLVHPYIDREPNMVLIEALHGGKPRITVEKPLIVYERPGVYTKDIEEIYAPRL